MTRVTPSIILVHSIVGKDLVGLEFDPDKPWRACMLCGRVMQRPEDRLPDDQITPALRAESDIARQAWADRHARTHTQREHDLLRMSGRVCTPEAAEKLVPLGIAPISDMVLSEEHREATANAPRLSTLDSLTPEYSN